MASIEGDMELAEIPAQLLDPKSYADAEFLTLLAEQLRKMEWPKIAERLETIAEHYTDMIETAKLFENVHL